MKTITKTLTIRYHIFDYPSQYFLAAKKLIEFSEKESNKVLKDPFYTSVILLSFVAVEALLKQLIREKARGKNVDMKLLEKKLEYLYQKGNKKFIKEKIGIDFTGISEYEEKKRDIRNPIAHHDINEIKKIEKIAEEAKKCFNICIKQSEHFFKSFGKEDQFENYIQLIN